MIGLCAKESKLERKKTKRLREEEDRVAIQERRVFEREEGMGVVLLVRHGETDGNRKKVLQVPELPLNANGLSQAAKLGRRVANSFQVRKILCSDLQRTQDTAAAIVKETGVEMELTPLLQERNFGDLRGRPYQELLDEGIHPFAPAYTPPNGESVEMFRVRTDKAWQYILDALRDVGEGEVLVVVTHGLVLSNFARAHIQLPSEDRDKEMIAFKNTSITAVHVTGTHNPYPCLDGIYNDDSHLQDTERDPDFASMLSRV